MWKTENVRVEYLKTQDDDNTKCELSNNEINHPQEASLSFQTEENNFDKQYKVLHPGEACFDETLSIARIPLLNK